jgi:hypothetical protein
MTKDSPTLQVLQRLLAEKGIRDFELFLLQQEGRILPNGLEQISGFIATPSGSAFGFWLEYDDRLGKPTLDPYYEVADLEKEFGNSPEFIQARARFRQS